MSYYYCQINGVMGVILAHNFRSDGTINEAEVGFFSPGAPAGENPYKVVNNSFVPLPKDWQNWSVQNPPPHGAHLYLDGKDYPDTAQISWVLANATRLQQQILAQIQAQGSGGGESGDSTATPPESGSQGSPDAQGHTVSGGTDAPTQPVGRVPQTKAESKAAQRFGRNGLLTEDAVTQWNAIHPDNAIKF